MGGIWSLALVRLSYPCLDPAEQNAEDPLTLHGGGELAREVASSDRERFWTPFL